MQFSSDLRAPTILPSLLPAGPYTWPTAGRPHPSGVWRLRWSWPGHEEGQPWEVAWPGPRRTGAGCVRGSHSPCFPTLAPLPCPYVYRMLRGALLGWAGTC